MKIQFIASTIACAFIQTTLANATPRPEKCPSIEAIRSVDINMMYHHHDGAWMAVTFNQKYDTNDRWIFIMETGQANNETEAFENAKKYLKSLNFLTGPNQHDSFGDWGCVYQTQFGGAFAITPLLLRYLT